VKLVLSQRARVVYALTTLLGWVTPLVAAASEAPGWAPPAPEFDSEFDWMELTSGEWLKGEFLSMYDESVEFDSDVLGVLQIDWEDVKQVRFAEPMGVRLDDRSNRPGLVAIEDDQLKFTNPADDQDKSDIVAIAPMGDSEWDLWSLEGRVGFDFQRGNTDETRYTSSLAAERRTAATRLKFSYLGNYTLTDSVETTNNHRANATFDYFFADRLFIRPFDGEYYNDKFQNIDIQLTLGGGFGYELIDTDSIDWEVLAGPAFQYTKFSTVPFGEPNTAQSAAGTFQTTFDAEITNDLDYSLYYQAIVTNSASGLLTQHVVTSLDYELTSIFDVFIMLQLDRVEKPAPRSDGTVPDKNDVTLSFGLGVDI